MKHIVTLLLGLLVASQGARAQEAKPSEESVRQLFQVMHISNIVDTLMTQTGGMVHASMQQIAAGEQLNAAQQKVLDGLQQQILALVKEQLKWADIEPMMVEVYRGTFTQQEIDGLLRFYRSPAGQSAITKVPAATQESMARIQNRLQSLTPRVTQLEKEAAAQLKAAATPQTAPAVAPH